MTLTIEIADDHATALAARANAEGVSAEQYARETLHRDPDYPRSRSSPASRIRGSWQDLPIDAAAGLPSDGASEVDHYVYGPPRRKP